MTPSTPIIELTVEDLMTLIRDAVQYAIDEKLANSPSLPSQQTAIDQRALFDIPLLHIDPRHPALHILSREDMYDDDGR